MTNFARTHALRACCVVSLGAILLSATACSTHTLSTGYDEPPEEVELGESVLEKRIRSIDEYYSEPRDQYSVETSYRRAIESVSPVNGYAGLWRAVRAAAWLAHNHPVPSQRVEFAKAGIYVGKRSKHRLSASVETWYYTGLCWLALANYGDETTDEQVSEVEYHLATAVEIDGGFDHCGPLRELGDFLRRKHDPDFAGPAVGSLMKATKLLERACNTCPDFAANQLALGRAYSDGKLFAEARLATDRVFRSPKPVDYSAEHQQWLYEAQTLREQITLLDNRSVESTAFDETSAPLPGGARVDDGSSVPASSETISGIDGIVDGIVDEIVDENGAVKASFVPPAKTE